MATESWSTRVRHDSDAVWQEWRDELITKLGLLVAAGVLAADETNITPGAGARPGGSTEGGYAVYHLNDALHATAPVYLRFGLGTGGTTTPYIKLTTGTSTNGSGVLGGTALSPLRAINDGSNAQVTDTARQSYMCCVPGFFGLVWKVGAGSNPASFFICRTCDSAGDPTATGSLVHWGTDNTLGAFRRQAFRYAATAVAYTFKATVAEAALGLNAQSPTNTTVGADIQVFLGWTIEPRSSPLFGVCGVNSAELTPGGTFSATLVGTTPRTFLTWPDLTVSFGPHDTIPGRIITAMLWE